MTTPHKRAVVALCDEVEDGVESVNTLVIRDGRVLGSSTDTEALGEPTRRRERLSSARGGAATAWIAELEKRGAQVQVFSRSGDWPPSVDDADLVVHATPVKDELLVRAAAGPDAGRPGLPRRWRRDRARRGCARRRVRRCRRPRRARRAGRGRRSSSGPGVPAPVEVDARRSTLCRVTLGLTTAGESHGPALVAILTGLPAGLTLDRAAIDADLRRRQQGYGRSPRQQLEQDEVEVLAGLRHGRTLGTPLALVVRNRDHANWAWGMSPWPPEGEPSGKGDEAGDAAAARPRRPRGRAQVRARRRPRRARAGERAAHRGVSSPPARSRRRCCASSGSRSPARCSRSAARATTGEAAIDAARADRDTLGGIVEVRATGVFPASAPTRRARSGSTRASPRR